MTTFYKRFDSVAAYCGYLAAGKRQPGFSSEESQKTGAAATRWTGTKDFATANYLMKYGDKESAKMLEQASGGRLKAMATRPRTTTMRHYYGHRPNVAAYVQGRPKCMYKRVTNEAKKPVITIIYNICANARESAYTMAEVNARFLQAILQIEASGVKTNLYVADVSYYRGNIAFSTIKVKDSGQRFNLLNLAYPLINPSMLRRHSFRFFEVAEGLAESFGDDYGRSAEDRYEMERALKEAKIHYDAAITYYDVKRKNNVDDIIELLGQK